MRPSHTVTHFVPLDRGRDVVAVQFLDIVCQRAGQNAIHSIRKHLMSFVRPHTLSSNWLIHLQPGGLPVALRRSPVKHKGEKLFVFFLLFFSFVFLSEENLFVFEQWAAESGASQVKDNKLLSNLSLNNGI